MKYLKRLQFPLMISALGLVILILALLAIKCFMSIRITTDIVDPDDVYIVVAWFLLTVFYAGVLYIGVFGTILSIVAVWLIFGIYFLCRTVWYRQVRVAQGKHSVQEPTRRLPPLYIR